jgi:hypothetical protein
MLVNELIELQLPSVELGLTNVTSDEFTPPSRISVGAGTVVSMFR